MYPSSLQMGPEGKQNLLWFASVLKTWPLSMSFHFQMAPVLYIACKITTFFGWQSESNPFKNEMEKTTDFWPINHLKLRRSNPPTCILCPFRCEQSLITER